MTIHPMPTKWPMAYGHLCALPHTCRWAHLDFQPEFSDARESFKCVQSLDFDTVVLVIQHGAHQRDVIISTRRGLECARRDRRGGRSGCPGPPTPPCHQNPSIQPLLPSARERSQGTVWLLKGEGGQMLPPGARLAGKDLLLPFPHLGLQQVHAARDTVQDHALGVLILFALQGVEEPPELT